MPKYNYIFFGILVGVLATLIFTKLLGFPLRPTVESDYHPIVISGPAGNLINQPSNTLISPESSAVPTIFLPNIYENKDLHYLVNYGQDWTVNPEMHGTVTFTLPNNDAEFLVSLSGEGVPTLSYYANLENKTLRPFTTINSKINKRTTCALRDDVNVYIQRDNVVYILKVFSVNQNTDYVLPLGVKLQSEFEAFVSSFNFLEPWSNEIGITFDPPVATPCWK